VWMMTMMMNGGILNSRAWASWVILYMQSNLYGMGTDV
jgi:hypothetical protein